MTNRGVGDRVGLGGVGLFVGGRVYLQAVSEKQLWPFMLIGFLGFLGYKKFLKK